MFLYNIRKALEMVLAVYIYKIYNLLKRNSKFIAMVIDVYE